ncbi:MAG: hypothetical protein UY06_C0036G0007 [Candidatus Amesbacteria bacterium GW2011_GWA2_47_70]|nr:MAG: hypothetical protein UX52_C0031G0009 [Candidatus Amesbacteria bacterium GW2011_GWA1_46_35]KKU78922.1 MAG: hypothetical protein UY06_C0036G0007 [Candidatus Amesbacteria bacterium GW2011_GWA2_47_70]
MRRVKEVKKVSKWLVVIGAINWGLVALLNYNLVTIVFGSWPGIEKGIYILVGAAGVWGAYAMLTNSKNK